jgi:hypothetical protein
VLCSIDLSFFSQHTGTIKSYISWKHPHFSPMSVLSKATIPSTDYSNMSLTNLTAKKLPDRMQYQLEHCFSYADFKTICPDLESYAHRMLGRMPNVTTLQPWIDEVGFLPCTQCTKQGTCCKRDENLGSARCRECVRHHRSRSDGCSRVMAWREWTLSRELCVTERTAAILLAWVRAGPSVFSIFAIFSLISHTLHRQMIHAITNASHLPRLMRVHRL